MTETLGHDELARLLEALTDDALPAVRVEALAALVALPLAPPQWREIGPRILELLEPGVLPAEHRLAAIGLAGRVPLRPVRLALREIAREGQGADRIVAARALANAGDATAAERLLEILEGNELLLADASLAECLARLPLETLGIGKWRIRRLLRRATRGASEATADTALWLTLALARIGALRPLARLLGQLDVEPPPLFQGNPFDAEVRLAAMRPVPERLRALLEDRADRHPESREIRMLRESLVGEPDASELFAYAASPEPAAPREPAGPAAAAAARAVAARLEQRIVEVGPLAVGEFTADEIAALGDLDPEHASAFEARLLDACVRIVREEQEPAEGAPAPIGPPEIVVGNFFADVAEALPPATRPPVRELYRVVLDLDTPHEGAPEAEPSDFVLTGLDQQVAWAISRRGFGEVLVELEPWLREAPAPQREHAWRMVSEVARWRARPSAPRFGAGPSFGEGFGAPIELIDDDDVEIVASLEGAPPTRARGGVFGWWPGRPARGPRMARPVIEGAREPADEPTTAGAPPPEEEEHATAAAPPPADEPTAAAAPSRAEEEEEAAPPPPPPAETATADAGPAAASRSAHPPTDPPRSAYALLDSPRAVVVGEPFTIQVGLSARRTPGVVGKKMRRPDSSFGPYTLTVQVMIDGFTATVPDDCRQDLWVTADAPHPSVTLDLVADASEDLSDARTIAATFSVDGQMIGMAARAVTVYADASRLPARAADEEAEGVDMTVPTQAIAADLTITIKRGDSRSGGGLLWTLETPWPGIALPRRAPRSDLGKEPKEFAKRLVPGVNLREGRIDLGSHLRGLGRQIAAKIPGAVLDTLRAVAQRVRAEHTRRPTVLLVSEEAYVPWELAYVEPPLYDDAPFFLATQAIVGRWILGQSEPRQPPPVDVPAQDMTVVWGRYVGVPGWSRLDAAEREGEDLHQRYHASHVDAKLDPVVGCLQARPGAHVLHFSVHGSYDPGGNEDGLVLTDRCVLAPSVVEGEDLPSEPFVFLNACQAGSGQEILGNYAGLAAAFVKRGASAVVAPIWSIKDDQAREIALAFYERAFQGEAPAEILREVRARFGAEPHPNSGTCLAYQFFGHPALRLRREEPPTV